MPAEIRLAQYADADAIAAIYRPIVEATAISFETIAPDGEEMARRLAETLPKYPWLVCDLGERIAGYAYACGHRNRAAYRWSVESSVYVEESFQRSGVGRGLYLSLFGILAAQGFFNAYAGITLPNPASVALHESMEFERIGAYRRAGYKQGRWHDVGWWQRTLREPEAAPREPIDLASICKDPGWAGLLARGQ